MRAGHLEPVRGRPQGFCRSRVPIYLPGGAGADVLFFPKLLALLRFSLS